MNHFLGNSGNDETSFQPPRMAAVDPQLIDSAANHIIAAHHLRIRFMHLLYNLSYPEITTPLSEFYSPALLDAVKQRALKVYTKFRVAGDEFRSLDGVRSRRRWVTRYDEAMDFFEQGAELLREFEGDADNLAVEWQAGGMNPVKEVEVGGLYPGVEDIDMETLEAAKSRRNGEKKN